MEFRRNGSFILKYRLVILQIVVEIRFQKEYLWEMTEKTEKTGLLKWVKRLGVAGFMFFLVKGLLWLIVPALIAYFSLT